MEKLEKRQIKKDHLIVEFVIKKVYHLKNAILLIKKLNINFQVEYCIIMKNIM